MAKNKYYSTLRAVVLLSIFLSSIITSTVQAISEDEENFYSGNNILFYRPVECTSSGSTSIGPTGLTGESNAEKVWNYFISRGLTPIAAAGAMGNLEQESAGFDPWAGEGGNASINKSLLQVGFGIIQWTNTGGDTTGRRYKVMANMEKNGLSLNATDKSQNDKALISQLDWLWDGEYGEMTWQKAINAETKVEGDPSKSFQSNNTGNGSTMVFHKLVERSADGASGKQERIDSAKAFLKKFGNGNSENSNSGSSSQGCSTSGSGLTEGGLTLEQAKRFMMNYGENKNNDSIKAMNSGPGKPGTGCNGGPLSNCVSFSAFFTNKFTSLKYRGGNGNEVVGNLAAAGAKTGNEPRLYAIFSNGFGTSAGHTGVILGIKGNTLIVGHASCSNPGTGRGNGTSEGGGAGFVKVGTINTGALLYTDKPKFAYPDSVNTKAIESYLAN